MQDNKLIYRVIAAALLLPAVVAGVIPAVLIVIDPWRQPVFFPGLIVPLAGVVITAFCIKDFYKLGSGTLAPWDAPGVLVAGGLYAYCRNPMYIGVLLVIAGLALLFTSPACSDLLCNSGSCLSPESNKVRGASTHEAIRKALAYLLCYD